jgi:hypothetical protein
MTLDQYFLVVTATQNSLHAFILTLLAYLRVLVEADRPITGVRDL